MYFLKLEYLFRDIEVDFPLFLLYPQRTFYLCVVCCRQTLLLISFFPFCFSHVLTCHCVFVYLQSLSPYKNSIFNPRACTAFRSVYNDKKYSIGMYKAATRIHIIISIVIVGVIISRHQYRCCRRIGSNTTKYPKQFAVLLRSNNRFSMPFFFGT